MKYENEEIKNINWLAKRLILKEASYLMNNILDKEFGGLDIRSPISREILKKEQGFECSELEAELLMKNLVFEIAKVVGKLENQAISPKYHTTPRNTAGHITKQMFGL